MEYDNLSRVVDLRGRIARRSRRRFEGRAARRGMTRERRRPRRRLSSSPARRAASARRWPRASCRRLAPGAGRAACRRGARLGRGAGLAAPTGPSTRPTCATSTASPRAGRACIGRAGPARRRDRQCRHQRRHGHRVRDDLEVMRATFETNILGMAATFQPFVEADARARAAARWSASPASPASAACPGTAPTARARPA